MFPRGGAWGGVRAVDWARCCPSRRRAVGLLRRLGLGFRLAHLGRRTLRLLWGCALGVLWEVRGCRRVCRSLVGLCGRCGWSLEGTRGLEVREDRVRRIVRGALGLDWV